eukprot:gnl/MRDRNA2_/MRDRNA2_93379_c0_seq1.p1 gnl/MRDRNA2_/MRDRNA2_93379_c0~~gnl/MRDRNA2_/MRDRNA2_93379_c0_seq1.p1  ORF type:complete len:536 (-),score=145.62 gnl/MRDRNA2_/MRDRNA2_93379_c0_seq1:135-1742(-)
MENHVTDEQYKEYGYPQPPEYMKDPNWWKENMERERTDPRVNPNLNVDMTSQQFWDNAARKPWAKHIMRHDQYWQDRRANWLEQLEAVNKFNEEREQIGELLEECPMQIKKLVTPILKYKITEKILWNVKRESIEYEMPFAQLLEREETMDQLQTVRKAIDIGGEQAAQELDNQLNHGVHEKFLELEEEKEKAKKAEGRIVIDMHTMKMALETGQKCKKDGLLEWQKGNIAEAHSSWRQGDLYLKRFKVQEHCKRENEWMYELHGAVLRNLAQACIKLEYWNQAIEASDDAIQIDDQDHKAWFRKACALEGLGKFDEATECLSKIEEIAVGRPDRVRIEKDCQAKKDKLASLKDRNKANMKRIMAKGFLKGVFSEERPLEEGPPPEMAHLPTPEEKPKVQKDLEWVGSLAPSEDRKPKDRKKITKDGALDLLDALEEAYRDPQFMQRVDKLAKDVRLDPKEFLTNLKKVAFEVQLPVLERWGFELNPRGVLEMQCAIQDHSQGSPPDAEVAKRAEEVLRLLYGDPQLRMYERIHG